MKKTALFIMHMPPPVHGASMVGQYIRESKLISNSFDCIYINVTTASSLEDIGELGLRKIWNIFLLLRRIYKSIKVIKPHLIYLTPNAAGKPFYKDFLIMWLVKRWAGKSQFFVHYHNKGCKDFSENVFNNFLYKIYFRGLIVILLSELLYEDVRKYVPRNRIRVCPNGVPQIPKVNKIIIHKSNELNRSNILHILFLSNMMEEKGVWVLLKACKILKEKKVNFRCTFVGDWNDISEKEFIDRVNDDGLSEFVSAVGAVYGDEKDVYWNNTDVFVFPTFYHNECFPLVLLEAMQHGLPCISTDEGAIPDIIDDGVTGFVVEKQNSQQLAARIIDLNNDRQRCAEMGLIGYEKFKKHYTIDAFERRICNIFEQQN